MTAATVLDSEDTIETEMRCTAHAAKEAGRALALADSATKNAALRAAAAAIRAHSDEILAANGKDMAAAEAPYLGAHLTLPWSLQMKLILSVVRFLVAAQRVYLQQG